MHIVLVFVGLFFLPEAHLLFRVVKRILLQATGRACHHFYMWEDLPSSLLVVFLSEK